MRSGRWLSRRWPWLRSPRLRLALLLVLVVVGFGACAQQRSQRMARERQRQALLAAPITTVTALGRLEPAGEVINVAAPGGSAGGQPVRLRRLLVEEGDVVERGQLLAEMDSLSRLSRAVQESQSQVALAETRLQVAIATQASDVLAQRARVQRARANLRTAAAEERRYRELYASGATSASVYEARVFTLESARADLTEARSRLQRLEASVTIGGAPSSLDVAMAQRDLQAARSHLERSRAERDDALVHAPIRGRVLSVLTRPGELSSNGGLLELGQTERMQLVAEVYESDRQRLRPGETVRITSRALSQPLFGRITHIGAIVRRQSLINTDPSANTDARVLEVHALLDAASSRRASDLSNLQVMAVFGR